MSDEMSKIRQKHKDNVSAQSDQVKNQLDMLKRKKEQILDAQAKRNKATNASSANANNSTAAVSSHHNTGLSTEQIDISRAVEAMLNEKLAAGGFNYEKEINDKLKKMGKAHKDSTTAGSSADAPDAKFNHNGKEHNLEVKQNQKAMFGQIELKHDGKKWDISERSKKKYPHTTDSILATGFLDKVNKQWDKPTGDYDTDLQKGNVYHTHHDAEPIKAHYGKDRKTDYIQIGGGHGFYHTGNDAAKLGSPELEGKATLRARMKYRGTDRKTGKKKYGALIVMGLKDAEKSHHNLDETVQRKWIEAALNETVLNPKDPHKDYAEKSKTLQDLSRNKDVDQAHVQQRRLDLDKEYAKYKKESIKAVKENATDWGSFLNEDTKCFVDAFWSGQQEEPKKNPHPHGTDEYFQYENGYMQGVMKRRVMQTESRGHKIVANFLKKRNAWYPTGKEGTHRETGEKTKEYHEVDDEGKPTGKRHWRNDKGENMGESYAPVAPAPHIHRIAVTVSDPDHQAVTQRGETHQKFVRVTHHNDNKDEAIERGKKHFAKKGWKVHDAHHVGMVHESVDKLSSTVTSHKHSHVLNKIKNGEWEAMTDVKPGKHVEVRNTSTGQRKMVNVLAEDGEGGAPVNNAGDGKIAGFAGDAGKKVKMTNEPLRRKPLPKFKTYVSQEHDQA